MEEDPAGVTSMSDFDRSTGTDETTGLNDPNGASEENLVVTDNEISVTLVPGEDDKRTTTCGWFSTILRNYCHYLQGFVYFKPSTRK